MPHLRRGEDSGEDAARLAATVSEFDGKWDALARVRQVLTALGFDKAKNQTLVSEGELKVQNPLSTDQHALRASLVPGLLANLRTNVSRHQYDVRLFEIGRVFAVDGGESLHLALAVTGRREPHSWETGAREAKMDYYDVKGTLEELFPFVTLSLSKGLPTAEVCRQTTDGPQRFASLRMTIFLRSRNWETSLLAA